MASKKKSSSSKKKSSRKGAGCQCGTINRKTGGSSGRWTQCRKKGRFVRMAQPKGKGIACDTYTNKGKTYRRCYKRVKNELTGRTVWAPVKMLKKCA